MKELQPLIDAIQEDFAIEDGIAYFIKVAENNAIFKELNQWRKKTHKYIPA